MTKSRTRARSLSLQSHLFFLFAKLGPDVPTLSNSSGDGCLRGSPNIAVFGPFQRRRPPAPCPGLRSRRPCEPCAEGDRGPSIRAGSTCFTSAFSREPAPNGAWGRWPSCLQRVYFRALQGVGRSRSFPCSPRSSSVPPSLSTSDRARCPRFLDLVGILHRGARPSHPRLRLLIITHRSAAQTPGRLAVACLIRTPLNSPFAAGRLRCNTFNLISVVLDVRTVSLSCYFNEAA